MTITVDALGAPYMEPSGYARLRDLAVFAQDCRHVLGAIRTATTVLERAGDLPRAREQVRRDIGLHAAHLTALVRSLVDLAALREGCLAVQPQLMNVNAAVGLAVEACLPALAFRGITVTQTQPHAPCYVNADPARLGQVIMNLISGVARCTQQFGRLDLTVQQAARQLSVCVEGTGGNSRLDGATSSDPPDSNGDCDFGISLALVKHIVELHGGTFDGSWSPAGGARLVATIPLGP